MKNKKENKTVLTNFRIEPEIKNAYTKFAKENGYSISRRLRMFVIKDMEGKIKIGR